MALAAAVTAAACTEAGADRARPDVPSDAGDGVSVRWDAPRIAGVSLSAPRRPVGHEAVAPIADLGAGWIAVVPYAFVDPADPVVRYDGDRRFWGETGAGVAATIGMAHARGLSVLLKPHLWVRGQGWPGGFLPADDSARARFDRSYATYIGRFARLADSLDVEMLAVGTEVDAVAIAHPEPWRGLIADVRAVYGGRLTYAANWDRFADIPFWDDLDVIGVDAYFPLASDPSPDVDRLVDAWDPWVRALAATATKYGRPVLFAEYGYRSLDGAAGEQWTLPEGRGARGLPANEAAQAAAYEALFRTWWHREWFAGGFLWEWHASPDRGRIATGYSPQGKEAEAVVRRWYSGNGR